MIGPPASPAPLPTLVTVPPLLASLPHTHALPFQRAIWLLAHAVVGSSCVVARLIVPMLGDRAAGEARSRADRFHPHVAKPIHERRHLDARHAVEGTVQAMIRVDHAHPSVIPFCAIHVM